MMRQAAGASPAETVTIENPGGRREGGQSETLVLRLNRKKKKVSWKPGTVDNELMQKKSSKKCCIFHKEKSFDEDDSDNDDDDHHPHHHHHHHHHEEDRDPDGACSSKDGH